MRKFHVSSWSPLSYRTHNLLVSIWVSLQARLKIGDTDLAHKDLLHAVKFDPNNKNLRELLKEANYRVKTQKKKEKHIYGKQKENMP